MDPSQPFAAEQESALTQSEVQRLLSQVSEPMMELEEEKVEAVSKLTVPEDVQLYDFRNPNLLSASLLRKLRGQHEEFIQALGARLSMYLRLEFSLKLSRLQTLSYQKFTAGLSNPSHITLFKVEPLRGVCLLQFNPQFGLTIVDRLMGGPGHPATASRDLSEIEVALLDQAVHIIVSEWCNHWPDLKDPRPVLLGHENNSRFLQTSSPDTAMLVLSLEAGVGDCIEPIQIAFPFGMIEPLVQKLGLKMNANGEAAGLAENKPKWRGDYADVIIPITAQWPDLEMTARELIGLKVGDVLDVEPAFANQVRVNLAGIAKFTGRLGTRGNKWAVEITQVNQTGK